jgi:hypothetical protein
MRRLTHDITANEGVTILSGTRAIYLMIELMIDQRRLGRRPNHSAWTMRRAVGPAKMCAFADPSRETFCPRRFDDVMLG